MKLNTPWLYIGNITGSTAVQDYIRHPVLSNGILNTRLFCQQRIYKVLEMIFNN